MDAQHFLVYKPFRMVSQFLTNDGKQKRKRFLKELGSFPDNTMAIGRLDEKTEGLLLLTTCGKTSDIINRSKLWSKTYHAQVDGKITQSAIEQLKNGVVITVNGKPYTTNPCEAAISREPDYNLTHTYIRDEKHGPTSWISITLNEGKFRQVRKMCSKVGFPVLRLVRTQIGPFQLNDVKNQKVIDVTDRLETILLEQQAKL